MSNVCIILGKSGTGKSTSIKTLNPDETIVINVLETKRLPFKGCLSMYNKEKKNFFHMDDVEQISKLMKQVSLNVPKCKNIVIDDSTYIMREEFFARAKEKGYEKFTEIAVHFKNLISAAGSLRDDLNIFFILHSEDVVSDGCIVEYKVATVGKMLETQYGIMETVTALLYSDVLFDDKKECKYGFHTNRCMKGGTIIPAKSPEGMFEDEFIPNDLQYVADKMEEYYK